MRKRKGSRKEELIALRISKDELKSVDVLAELVGTSRSDVIRRFLPDLTNAKNLSASLGV